ncbi:MAG: autotransporter-associated beta strand repeat-containing protein [Candidatus Udaeobacter sp.]
MKSFVLSFAIVLTLSLTALNSAYAGSATWNTDPISNDWNTADNWTPATVPNGQEDIATFGVSNTTELQISSTVLLAGAEFTPGASAYQITIDPGIGLTFEGSQGVINNSGQMQTFVLSDIPPSTDSSLSFVNNATAGDLVTYESAVSNIDFLDTSSAGSANFVIGAEAGSVQFFSNASAGSATILVNGPTVSGELGGQMNFFDSATADNATLIATNGVAGGGFAVIRLENYSQGVEARVELFGSGSLDISHRGNRGVGIGSLEGDGVVGLGAGFDARNLAVGSNNLSTVFSGVIQNDGSLTKVGHGTLTLSHSKPHNSGNTYTGGTTIEGGNLVISNQNGSGTGSGPVSVTRGKLGGSGIIAGATTIGTGSGPGAFLAPAVGTSVHATLTIESGLTFNAAATYTCTFKANPNQAKTDMVIANGVTINNGAMIELIGHINGALPQGLVLTLISNTSASPIIGTFSNLPDGGIVTINGNNFQASYESGDGNDLTLTVVP